MSDRSARINARLAARWARRTVERMKRGRSDIDALNVFPIPDGDTGSNMYFTVRSAYRAVENLTGTVTLHGVVEAMANGALRGARGNSGLILSVALRGVADALEGVTELDAPTFAGALELAASRAQDAVADPVAGTMITVLHEMAREARTQADNGAHLVEQIAAVRIRSREALRETTGQLQVLKDNQVVDAGSTGIVEIFDLLYLTVTGRPPGDTYVSTLQQTQAGLNTDLGEASTGQNWSHSPLHNPLLDPETGLELVFFLHSGKDRSRAVKKLLLKAGGTSVVVSWPKVHVHVDTEERAHQILAECASYGIEMLRIEELSMTDHQAHFRSVIAVTHGIGMMQALATAEAMVVNADLSTWPETLAHLISDTDVDAVLPDSADTLKRVHAVTPAVLIVDSTNPVAQLSAMAVYDPELTGGELVELMNDCLAGLSTARVEQVGETYLYSDGETRGMADTGPEAIEAAALVLTSAGGEVLTVVGGEFASTQLLDHARAVLRKSHPNLSIDIVAGDVPGVVALVGCE